MRANKTSLPTSVSIVAAVVLSTALLLVIAASADAAVRFTSPTGTNSGASCPEIDPCSLTAALDSTFTADGDQVVMELGTYNPPGQLTISEDVDLFSNGLPTQVTINMSSGIGILLGNDNARLAGFTIEHTGTSAAILGLYGTVETVIARSTAGNACAGGGNSLFRNTLCASSGANRAGVNVNVGGGTANLKLRNVTAIGSGASSRGIETFVTTAGTLTIDAKATIARGVAGDVSSTATDAGTTSEILLSNSNFDTVSSSGTGGGVSVVSADNINNNQSTAPIFVNAGTGDYHQASNSPTIDAGGTADVDTGTLDFDKEASG